MALGGCTWLPSCWDGSILGCLGSENVSWSGLRCLPSRKHSLTRAMFPGVPPAPQSMILIPNNLQGVRERLPRDSPNMTGLGCQYHPQTPGNTAGQQPTWCHQETADHTCGRGFMDDRRRITWVLPKSYLPGPHPRRLSVH